MDLVSHENDRTAVHVQFRFAAAKSGSHNHARPKLVRPLHHDYQG